MAIEQNALDELLRFHNLSPKEAQGYIDGISGKNQPRQYKYTSTKEYHDAFPCAYRQYGELIVTVT